MSKEDVAALMPRQWVRALLVSADGLTRETTVEQGVPKVKTALRPQRVEWLREEYDERGVPLPREGHRVYRLVEPAIIEHNRQMTPAIYEEDLRG